MMIIFDPNDVEEFQELIEDFEYDFFFTPMDIEPIFNSMKAKGTSMRIRIDGEKHYIHADQVQKELENLIRWCFKKLNSYYVKYGVNIEGIDVSEIPDYGGSMP